MAAPPCGVDSRLVRRAGTRQDRPKWLSSECAHQLALAEEMWFERLHNMLLRRARFQLQRSVERVQFEVIPMRLSRRWARAPIAHLFEVVDALASASRQRLLRLDAFIQSALARGHVVYHPMNPCAVGRVGIVRDQREGL